MGEKNMVPYKSEVVYNTLDNRAVDIKIDFNPDNGQIPMPKLIVELEEEISPEDMAVVIESVEKNIKYRMDYDIFTENKLNVDLEIFAGGELKSYGIGRQS